MVRRLGHFFVGWSWYILTLLPVVGLIQVGAQAMADRYTYLPSIGIFMTVAWFGVEAAGRWRYGKETMAITAIIVLCALAVCTRMQVRYWRDSMTLFGRALAVTENNFIMHNNYGLELLQQRDYDAALAHFEQALRINPLYAKAHYNKARVLIEQSKFDEAISILKDVTAARQEWPEPIYYLGVAYARKGDYQQAVSCFEACLQRTSGWASLYNDLGLAQLLLGKYNSAIENLRQALRLDPDYPGAANNLNVALTEYKKAQEYGQDKR
jgi:tetratricopeptide (TPR) repeat protein